jgi:hypothetical protein
MDRRAFLAGVTALVGASDAARVHFHGRIILGKDLLEIQGKR